MNKKLSILLVASFFAAILSANNVSAAKYTVENVENNPQYRFLSQRLVRLEIDEDEEIDFEELAKNIFVPSKTKCPVAKAWNGLNAKTAQTSIATDSLFDKTEGTLHGGDETLGDTIKKLQKDKSFSSGNIKSSIVFSVHYGDDWTIDESIFILDVQQKDYANHNYPESPDGYVRFHVLNASPTIDNYQRKEYLDLSVLNPYPGTTIQPMCTSFLIVVSENFELIIKRKPQTIENPDIDSQDKKEETLQEIQENSPTTESVSIPIQAPNTGHSTNFAPLIAVSILTTITGLFFIKKR